nr:glutamate--cysteine ligase [Natrinema caseinilyticum]
MNTSIEVDYWIVDTNGRFADPGALSGVATRPGERRARSLVRVSTPTCETIPELRAAFVAALQDVFSRAAKRDKRLVPFATPINGATIDERPRKRGRILKEATGTSVDHATYCAGTHVRIEERNAIDQLNTLLALDPALALVNSSPYVRGERVANGARASRLRRTCDEPSLGDGRCRRYVDTVGEWDRRLEYRYERVKTAAVEAGVDAEAFEEHISSDDVVWTPVRLREGAPTVEWRSPDTALPSQLLRLVEELEAVMERLQHAAVRIDESSGVGNRRDRTHSGGSAGLAGGRDRTWHGNGGLPAPPGRVARDGVTLPDLETVRALVERAIHDGLESAAVASYLERMGFSVDSYHPIATRIDGRQYVTRADARELRLEYANRLEEDVAELASP